MSAYPRVVPAIWKFSGSVTAIVPGESNRGVEPKGPSRGIELRARKAAFPRSARLLRHADFERVYKLGRRHFSASLTVFYLQRQEVPAVAAKVPAVTGLRTGFTVGRALGGAVQRNRMKRRLREAVRLSRPPVGPNADVVINPKKSLLATDFTEVLNEVRRAFVVIEQKLARDAGSGRAGECKSGPSEPALSLPKGPRKRLQT